MSDTATLDPKTRKLLTYVAGELREIGSELRELGAEMRLRTPDGRSALWMQDRATEIEAGDPETAARLRKQASEILDGIGVTA